MRCNTTVQIYEEFEFNTLEMQQNINLCSSDGNKQCLQDLKIRISNFYENVLTKDVSELSFNGANDNASDTYLSIESPYFHKRSKDSKDNATQDNDRDTRSEIMRRIPINSFWPPIKSKNGSICS